MIRRPALVFVVLAACGGTPAPVIRQASPTSGSTSPRSLVATGLGARVSLTEGGGFLIDGNAPPPPPGTRPGTHDAVHGDCSGDVAGCSRAGNVVRAARTFDEVVSGLRSAGFDVTVR